MNESTVDMHQTKIQANVQENVQANVQLNEYTVKFHGEGGEYFQIWIVNLLLSIVTFGIYSAWATVRRRRYFYGNTEIDGDRFDYHAEPKRILIGRLVAVGMILLFSTLISYKLFIADLLLFLFIVAIPALLIRSWRFNAIMSSFRGVRFNYQCRYGRAYTVMALYPVLLFAGFILIFSLVFSTMAVQRGEAHVLLSTMLFILFGVTTINSIINKMVVELFVNNLFYGQQGFKINLKIKSVIKIHLITLLIFSVFIIFALALLFFQFIFQPYTQYFYNYGLESIASQLNMTNMIIAYLIMLLGGVMSISYKTVAMRNLLFNHATFANGMTFKSTMQFSSYILLQLTNTLLVMFSLGLATPFAHVRHARYITESVQLMGDLSLNTVEAHAKQAKSAVSEEIVQAFDINIGL